MQRLRDAEDEQKYGHFAGVEGDIVSGVVQQGHDPRTVLVDLGKIEAIMPQAEQVPGERYPHGTRIKVYVVAVRRELRGPQIVVSRTHPDLVEKLFALEVPEIADGTVEIKAVAPRGRPPLEDRGGQQQPGRERQGRLHRADGAAGPGGDARAQRGEDRHHRLVAGRRRVRRQGVVAGQGLLGDRGRREPAAARVVVPDYQLSLAIGREGQNARLAARLTGWRIDIRSDTAPPG